MVMHLLPMLDQDRPCSCTVDRSVVHDTRTVEKEEKEEEEEKKDGKEGMTTKCGDVKETHAPSEQ